MIIGIGCDVVDIRRVEKLLLRFGDRFTRRLFTEKERFKADQHMTCAAASYAKRFAGKEACLKAIGTGLRNGISWHHMELTNLQSGKPIIELSGKALHHLHMMTPPDHESKLHVTIADDYPIAQAFIVIETIHR